VTWFLDTNICVYFLRNTRPAVAANLRMRQPSDIKIPAIVAAELRLGAAKSANPSQVSLQVDKLLSQFEITPFDESCAREAASIRAVLERRGKSIGPNDLFIAATVRAHNGVLVTNDTGEFARVPGLHLADWT
jgi:tRNA(fMet)-specific endonuclease VapC